MHIKISCTDKVIMTKNVLFLLCDRDNPGYFTWVAAVSLLHNTLR